MKRFVLALIAMLGIAPQLWAQTASLVLRGDRVGGIILEINGVQINAQPLETVRADFLPEGFVRANVTVKTTTGAVLGDVKDFAVENGYEMTYSVSVGMNGKLAYRLLDKRPSALNTPPGSTTTTTTTTTTTPSGGGGGINVNVVDPITGQPVNMGININLGGGTTQTQTQTTRTTTTVNGQPANLNVNVNVTGDPAVGQPVPQEPAPAPAATPAPAAAPVGCMTAMNSGAFTRATEQIEKQSFAETKMTIAKQVLANNCVNVNQVKTLMGLFTFENDKLTIAKYCYTRCVNANEYYLVNDAFTFDSSVDDLNAFIQKQGGPVAQPAGNDGGDW